MVRASYTRRFIILFIIVVAVFLAIWRKLQIDKIPYGKVLLNASEEYESIKIPPRPGLQGITITGAVIQPLVFSIIGNATVTALDWNRLDSHVVVKITAKVDERGRLFINEMRSGGYTKAGFLIQDAIETWIYTPYKTGIIKFFFNLPSKGKKLIIDTSRLRRKKNIPSGKPIYDGRVYFIKGVKPSEVGIGTFQ